MKLIKQAWCLALVSVALLQPARAQNGEEIYATRCAACHENPVAGAAHPPPARTELAKIASNTIYNALSQGVMRMQASGLSEAQMRSVSEFLTGEAVAVVPLEITKHLELAVPGEMENTGSDHSSFLCRGAPGFRLQSPYDEYRQYTWHTTIDTYDKIVLPDLKNNATLAAMLAYAASEDPERVSREAATREGQRPNCPPVVREFRMR